MPARTLHVGPADAVVMMNLSTKSDLVSKRASEHVDGVLGLKDVVNDGRAKELNVFCCDETGRSGEDRPETRFEAFPVLKLLGQGNLL